MTPLVFLQCRAYPQLQIDDRPVPLKLKRGLALLVYLSELARPRSRRQVAETLWPDAQADIGRARLRRLCHEVNGAVGLDLLVGDADALWLDCAVDTDVAVARRHAQGVLTSAADAASPASLQCLVAGDSHQLLEGFDLDSDLFCAWLDMRRSELERLVLRALERLAESSCQRQQPGPAIAAAARLIALDPCADAGHAALLEARAMQGDAAAVEACYFECAEVLRSELGIRPTARIEAAYAQARLRLERPSEIRAPVPSRLPEIRFADTGDGAVAYLELGRSDTTTLLVNMGLWSHLEVAWDEPRIRAVLDRLSRHFRVVLMDRRGIGLSERLAMQHTVAAGVEDLDAVRKALGVDRLWLLGASVGGTIAIDYAASRPQHVHGLLLYAVNVRGSSTSDYPWALSAAQLEKWLCLLQSEWGGATSLAQFAPSMADDPATREWWARMLRQSASRSGVHGLLRALRSMDVRDRLAEVKAPAMIVQRQNDRIVREGAARYLAAHIAGARLALLAGDDHLMWVGDTDAILDTMEAFVQEVQAKSDD